MYFYLGHDVNVAMRGPQWEVSIIYFSYMSARDEMQEADWLQINLMTLIWVKQLLMYVLVWKCAYGTAQVQK